MKRFTSFLLIFFFYISSIRGQEIKVGAYGGWAFGRPVDNYHYAADFYEGVIQAGLRQGLSVSCFLENSYDIGIQYYHQKTTVPTVFHSGGSTFDHQFDMTIQWILADFVAYFAKKSVRPFIGSDMGVGILTLKDPAGGPTASRVKFTWGGNLGIEFAFKKLISLRVKGDALYTVKFSSPKGGPTQSNITAYNSYLQTGINAGIVFRFKMHKKK